MRFNLQKIAINTIYNVRHGESTPPILIELYFYMVPTRDILRHGEPKFTHDRVLLLLCYGD